MRARGSTLVEPSASKPTFSRLELNPKRRVTCRRVLPWLLAANVGVLLLLLLLLAEDETPTAARTQVAMPARPAQPMQPMPPGQLAFLRLPGADIGMREWMHCGCGQLRHKLLACTFAHTSNGSDIAGKNATLIATHGAFAPLHRAAVNGLFSVGVFVTVVKDPVQRLWDLYRTGREVRSSGSQDRDHGDALSCLSLLPLDLAMRALDCAALGVDSKQTCLAAICPSCPLACLDQVSNALVRQLGARESDATGTEDDVAMFTQAQRKLRLNFRVVGLSERPEDTFRLLKAAFGWLDSTACPLHSTAVPSSKDHPPPLLLEALQKRNALDVQLYASARASFERALAKLPQEAAPEPMFVHVHGAGTGGQDSKKNSKDKKKKKKQKKKQSTVEKDSDGEKVDGDGETADSHSEKADGHGEKVDGDGVQAQEAVGDGEKVNGDQTDADAEKADDGNDAGEAPPRASARQKALLTAQWLTAQEADASSPDDANPLADADESDETGDASLRGAAGV